MSSNRQSERNQITVRYSNLSWVNKFQKIPIFYMRTYCQIYVSKGTCISYVKSGYKELCYNHYNYHNQNINAVQTKIAHENNGQSSLILLKLSHCYSNYLWLNNIVNFIHGTMHQIVSNNWIFPLIKLNILSFLLVSNNMQTGINKCKSIRNFDSNKKYNRFLTIVFI